MPQGLQAWDAGGVLTLDITDRIARVLGTQQVSGGSGTISHAAFTTGTPFAIPVPLTTSFDAPYYEPGTLVFSWSGTTMSWTRYLIGPAGATTDFMIIYGVS